MVAFLKVYQENWLDQLIEARDADSLEDYYSKIELVCKDILDDDTGGTDELTMKMADILRTLSMRLRT